MGWIRKWSEEHSGDGGQELKAREIGKWMLSLWLSWDSWGFGVSVEREYGSPMWPDRLHLDITLGPLTFVAVRTWNELSR